MGMESDNVTAVWGAESGHIGVAVQDAVAVVTSDGEPVTPEVASVWPSTNPLMVDVKVGLAAPNSREAFAAVTVNGAWVTVSDIDES